MRDVGLHAVLFLAIGLAICLLGAIFSESDDARMLKSLPKRLLVFSAGCGLLALILIVCEYTVARVE